MIAKFINKGNILQSQYRPQFLYRRIFYFSTTSDYVEEYTKILIQLNFNTLKNEMIKMKNVPKKNSLGLKKNQIITQLCNLQPNLIKQRVKYLRNKPISQVEKEINLKLALHINEKKVQSEPLSVDKENKQKLAPKKQSLTVNATGSTMENHKIIENTLKIVMPSHLLKILKEQNASYDNIMNSLYGNHLQKNKKKLNTSKSKDSIHPKSIDQNNSEEDDSNVPFSDKELKIGQMPSQTLTKLKAKPFVNLLFKTNEQVFIEEQKRKYLYEYQKSQIINQLQQSGATKPIQQDFVKNYEQIRSEKKDGSVMQGFYIDTSITKIKKLIVERKDYIVKMFCGFNYFKQLCTSSHLVRFIYAITFEKELPVQATILKIAEESRQNPQVFKQNLMVISKDYFLKLLKISANYLAKMFKRADQLEKKDLIDKKSLPQEDSFKDFDVEDDEFDEDDEDTYNKRLERVKRKAQKQEQQQRLPESRQFIDLQLMQYAFSLFQAGIQRVVREITSQKVFSQTESQKYSELTSQQQKQVKTAHETLMLCFEIYKTMESLFGSIEINDFNDLDKLMSILEKYHKIRNYLLKEHFELQKFIRKYDPKYEQKIELGLSNIVTLKQLQKQNFVLTLQARKLNFDIIDNITSMLKHDNIQITLENKRDRILKVLERFFKVYVENDMLNFLEDELIYAIVRFLEKQVYLDKKVKGLFEARVNFSGKTQDQRGSTDPKTEQMSQQPLSPSSQLEWFPSFQSPSSTSSVSQQNLNQFSEQKHSKSHYYMGQLQDLLSKELLFYLINIIKHKHERKEIKIEHVNGFNLIQEWYSQPAVVRLHFLKEEILQTYKRLQQRDEREKQIRMLNENQTIF